MVFLDSGYIGCTKRAEIQAIPFKDVSWYIAAKPSAWKKELSISENFGGELGQALVECVNVKGNWNTRKHRCDARLSGASSG